MDVSPVSPSVTSRGGSLILAPHPDDAAFSLGGAILGRHVPWPISIVTLFGRSNYAMGQFNSDVERVSALRRSEDEMWARGAKLQLFSLGYPEAALRCGSSFAHVFGSPDLDGSVAQNVALNIESLVDISTPHLLAAPLGIGHHCDHVIAREVAKNIVRDRSIVAAFYEDLPYARHTAKEDIDAAVSEALRDPLSIDLRLRSGELDAKCASLFNYATQIDEAIVRAVHDHSLSLAYPHGAERLWLSAADGHFARVLR